MCSSTPNILQLSMSDATEHNAQPATAEPEQVIEEGSNKRKREAEEVEATVLPRYSCHEYVFW